MTDFQAWPKMPRLNRNAVVTEKIDGTNAAIIIEEKPFGSGVELPSTVTDFVMGFIDLETGDPEHEYWVSAQSRTRLITPGKKTDNYGFAEWVRQHSHQLVQTLGPGRHFGEWWGKGIQRGYDMDHKVFSLFNTAKWDNGTQAMRDIGVRVVPRLYEGPFAVAVDDQDIFLENLRQRGSIAAPGYMKPEGLCIYSEAANISFKVTIDNDGKPKASAS